MRSLVLAAAVASTLTSALAAAPADPDARVTAEVRAGYGLASGGGAGRSSTRTSPLLLSVSGAWLLGEQPRRAAYAGLLVETLDRTGAGGEAGILLPGRHLRLRAGAKIMALPYTLHGATAGAGLCSPREGMQVCAHLDADVFVAGTDLPDGGAVVQLLVGLGVVIDAL